MKLEVNKCKNVQPNSQITQHRDSSRASRRRNTPDKRISQQRQDMYCTIIANKGDLSCSTNTHRDRFRETYTNKSPLPLERASQLSRKVLLLPLNYIALEVCKKKKGLLIPFNTNNSRGYHAHKTHVRRHTG